MKERKEVVEGLRGAKHILISLSDKSSFREKCTKVDIVFHGPNKKRQNFFVEFKHFAENIRNPSSYPILVPRHTDSADITFQTNVPDYDLGTIEIGI